MRLNSLAALAAPFAAWILALGLAGPPQKPPALKGVTVTAFLATDCPVSMRQTPRLKDLFNRYGSQGVQFRAVFPQELETSRRISAFMKERGLAFPWSLDLGGVLAGKKGVKTVPSFLVTDARGKAVYFGSLDDSAVDAKARRSYLADALASLAQGKAPKTARTSPFGCVLMAGSPPPAVAQVTYADHAAAIINRRCAACHRPGDTAPFSLIGYENARKWAPMIARVVQSRVMPPWPAVEGVGEFHDSSRLSEREIATLVNWSEAKAPRGKAAREPKAPVFPPGWRLGRPDILLRMPEAFTVPADGDDEYWNFVIDPKLDHEVYVRAVDVHPGSRAVVHHVIAFLDERGMASRQLAKPGSRSGGYRSSGGGIGFIPSGSLGGWAPGVQPNVLPEGAAWFLKPGTRIVLQVHYTKTGRAESDQTEVALYLTPKKPASPVTISWLAKPSIVQLPAGQKRIPLAFEREVPSDIDLFFLMPHMHLLGREMKADLIRPDGVVEPLIEIDDWDFNWQFVYRLKTPKRILKGSRIRVEAVYDNSSDNPRNPHDPPQLVRWGEETKDEMMLLVAGIAPARGSKPASVDDF